jgi:hypothetical protein
LVLSLPVLKTRCPECRRSLGISEEMVGATVRCPLCQNRFVLSKFEFLNSDTSLVSAAALETRADAADRSTPEAGGAPAGGAALDSTAIRQISRFQILGTLGRGGFGVVYRAYDPLLNREVALKSPRFPPSDRLKSQRFLAEAKAAGKLRHPQIVAVYESGEANGQLFIVSEYIEGQTLAACIQQQRPDFRQSAEWVRWLADALAYAHAEGIVHRDIKPQNVMIDRHNRPQIMDFGLAKRLDQDSTMTSDGGLLGTPAYMAPEQARGEADNVGPRSDQYSLATILYELLTGRKPFEGSPAVVVAKVASDDPPRPRSLNPEIPADLEAICLKGMERDPDRRYFDTSQMGIDLGRWLQGETVTARLLTPNARLVRAVRRRPRVAALTGAVASLLVLAAIGSAVALGMTVRSKHGLTQALADVTAETARTEKETQKAHRAEKAARESTKSANLAAERARVKRAAAERLVLHLEELVDRKIKAEEQLAAAIAERRSTEAKGKELAETRSVTEAVNSTVQSAAAIARRKIYFEILPKVQQALDKDDKVEAARLLDECPVEERRWEWRYLQKQCRTNEARGLCSIVYSMYKDRRTMTVMVRKPRTEISMGGARVEEFPAEFSYFESGDGRRMPDVDDDFAWANIPPAIVPADAVVGAFEKIAPTGKAVLTTQMDDHHRLLLRVCSIGEAASTRVLHETFAPMRRVVRPPKSHDRKTLPYVGFAFSRDGESLAQLSTNPSDLRTSLIRKFSTAPGSPPRVKWTDWLPDDSSGKDLLAAAKSSPGSPVGIVRYHNDRVSDASSQLISETDLAVSPDGSRVARFENDLKIHVIELSTSRDIVAFSSGLDVDAFLAECQVNRLFYDPVFTFHPGGVTWSRDGKRLIVQVAITSTYVWGHDLMHMGYIKDGLGRVISNAPSIIFDAPGPIRVAPIHFDCLIVLNAE